MSALDEVWAEYKALLHAATHPPYRAPHPDSDKWAARIHDAILADWTDWNTRTYRNGPATLPVLRYTPELSPNRWKGQPVYIAITEPCLFCGKQHTHGNSDGSRSAHCEQHSHDLTPTGRRKNPRARSTILCPGCYRGGYDLLRADARERPA